MGQAAGELQGQDGTRGRTEGGGEGGGGQRGASRESRIADGILITPSVCLFFFARVGLILIPHYAIWRMLFRRPQHAVKKMSSGRLIGVCAVVRRMQEKKDKKLALSPHDGQTVEAEHRRPFTAPSLSFFFFSSKNVFIHDGNNKAVAVTPPLRQIMQNT